MSGLDDLVKGIGNSTGGGLGNLLGGLAGSRGSGGDLDDIVGALTGGDGTGGRAGGMGGLLGSLLPAVGGMLAGGGLQQILAGFQANGRAEQADSWIGTGANEPVSADDVRKALGSDELEKLAARLGVSTDEAADTLAQILPDVVDRVSPGGHLASDAELQSAFEALERAGDAATAGGETGEATG
jgi:uncharacterized protein YidB (DUF937 family)